MDYELGVKVRNVKTYTREIDNLYSAEYKSDTANALNLYLDRDVYLTLGAMEDLKKVLSPYHYRAIDTSLLKSTETAVSLFFKECYASRNLSFEKPDGQYFVIYREPLFDKY